MNPLACLICALLLSLPTMAMAQFTYTVTNNVTTITAYTGPGGAVTIPDTLGNVPVASIGCQAFG